MAGHFAGASHTLTDPSDTRLAPNSNSLHTKHSPRRQQPHSRSCCLAKQPAATPPPRLRLRPRPPALSRPLVLVQLRFTVKHANTKHRNTSAADECPSRKEHAPNVAHVRRLGCVRARLEAFRGTAHGWLPGGEVDWEWDSVVLRVHVPKVRYRRKRLGDEGVRKNSSTARVVVTTCTTTPQVVAPRNLLYVCCCTGNIVKVNFHSRGTAAVSHESPSSRSSCSPLQPTPALQLVPLASNLAAAAAVVVVDTLSSALHGDCASTQRHFSLSTSARGCPLRRRPLHTTRHGARLGDLAIVDRRLRQAGDGRALCWCVSRCPHADRLLRHSDTEPTVSAVANTNANSRRTRHVVNSRTLIAQR